MIEFDLMKNFEEWKWFQNRTHTIRQEDSVGIVAYKDDKLVAVCVLDTFTPVSCTVHFAIDYPLVIKHGFFTVIADYAYKARNVQRLVGLVPSNNGRALRLDKKIGFKEVARIPNTIDEGVDTVVMMLEKEDCRWLSKELTEAA